MANNIEFTNNLDDYNVTTALSCTPEHCRTIIYESNKNLKLLTLNIRSINKNFSNFETLLSRLNMNIDILVLTECWLSCLSNSYLPLLNSYNTTKTTANLNQNDGVVVYTKSDLPHTSEELDFKGAASGILLKLGSDTAIFCIYRSPSISNIEPFLLIIDQIIPSLSSYKTLILTGDINIDITPNSIDTRYHNYLNRLAFHGFLPAHDHPTRDR